MRSVAAVIALSALSMVAAQNSTQFKITITDVSEATRNTWCIAQEDTCITLCDNNPSGNTCDFSTLNYYCTCQNGTEPGLQYYVNTIDTFTCDEAFSECTLANVGDSSAQRNCTTSIKDTCGTLDPASYSASSTTTSSTPSSATASTSTSSSAGTAATTASAAGAAATNLHRVGSSAAAAALGLVVYML